MAMTRSMDVRVDGGHDFAVWEGRLERWRRVRHLLERAESGSGRLRRECVQAAASELTLLGPGEGMWTFPGADRLVDLKLALTDAEPADAAGLARSMVRMLELYGDAATVAARDLSWTERYFTAMVLGDDAHARTTALTLVLGVEEHTDDRRAYALLATPTLAEAQAALRANPWIEAALLQPAAMATLEPPLRRERPTLAILPSTLPPSQLHARLCAVG